MTNSGWIKLHRKILDNPFCREAVERLGFWTYLLLKANHEDNSFYLGNQKLILKKGEFVTGRKKMEDETGLHRSKIERYLKQLELEQQIEQQKNNKFRIIKIKKWGDYQDVEQQMSNKKTKFGKYLSKVRAEVEELDTKENEVLSEQQMSNKRATDEQQMSTNKNDKNDKNTITNVIEAKPQEYGNPEINKIIEQFKKIMGFDSAGGKAKDRICASHLVKTYSSDQIWAMMTYCATDKYAPRIGSIEKLWYKRGDIIAGIKSLQSNKTILEI